MKAIKPWLPVIGACLAVAAQEHAGFEVSLRGAQDYRVGP